MDLKCRACLLALAPSGAVSLLLLNKDKIRLTDILMKVAPISIFEGDALPKVICLNCFDKMSSAYEFREKVIDVDLKLRREIKVEFWHLNEISDEKFEMLTEDPLKVTEDPSFSTLPLIKPELEVGQEIPESTNTSESMKTAIVNSIEIVGQFPISSNLANEENGIKVEFCNFGDVNFEKVADVTAPLISIEEKITQTSKLGSQVKKQPSASLRVRKKDSRSKIVDPTVCDQCGKTFKNKHCLKIHSYRHQSEGFNCDICNKTFVLRETLRVHKRIHSDERPYKCSSCDKAFRQKSALNKHIMIHEGLKPYTCPTCGKSFRQMAGLKVHERTHTGEKPYVCEFCSASFSELGTLRKHLVTHSDANLPLLPCDICGRTFKHPRLLQVHVKRNHLKQFEKYRHKCDTCGKKFTTSWCLKSHMMVHTGEKPYRCKICEKSFRQATVLVRHMRTHSGEKPYPCEVCDKRFPYSHHLLKHMNKEHPSEGAEK